MKDHLRYMVIGFITTISLFSSNCACSDPWFTGPLLAPAAKSIPPGEANFEPYLFDTKNMGVYNRHWRLTSSPGSETLITNLLLGYGLFDRVDTQINLPYTLADDTYMGKHLIGDVSLLFGYHALKSTGSWVPDIRFVVQEIFPTGRFDELNPTNIGSDATGFGSYQTGLGVNFQWLVNPFGSHYLRTRIVCNYFFASSMSVSGRSIFGGNSDTNGEINPGGIFSFNVATEFTLTQNWVAVMEGYIAARDKAVFQGDPGFDSTQNQPLKIGHGNIEEITLAPALEYNFSSNVGVIAGVWWSIAGRETSNFRSIVAAININF